MREFELHFSPIAEKDLDEIAIWYKRIRKGLNDEFIFCLEIELEPVKRNPFIYGN
jgi:hypothetical protein